MSRSSFGSDSSRLTFVAARYRKRFNSSELRCTHTYDLAAAGSAGCTAAMRPHPSGDRILALRVRQHLRRELYDESQVTPRGRAVYSLADPRELRMSRYIGQTLAPHRRFSQHLGVARLALPRELPWCVVEPKLRPLYMWIRDLYFDEDRLPTMIIHEWTATVAGARLAERARIYQALGNRLPLLNVESEILGTQYPLL
jgi:hypothetical protein